MPATYEPIATTTLGSAASTITFSSIPATYTDLRLVVNVISAGNDDMRIRVNSSATGYSNTSLYGTGATVTSSRSTSATEWYPTSGFDAVNNYRLYIMDYFSYAGSTNKTMLLESNGDKNGSGIVARQVCLWSNTAAINRVDLVTAGGNNFNTGTTATLYGIKNA